MRTQHHTPTQIRLLDTVACALRTLDALHLAVALSEGIELVTADHCLSAAAEETGHPRTLLT